MIPGTPSLVGKTSCLLLPLCCPSPPKYTNRTRLSQMVLTAENSNGPTVVRAGWPTAGGIEVHMGAMELTGG